MLYMASDNFIEVPDNIKFVNISCTDFLKLNVLFKTMSFPRSIEVLTKKQLWFSNPIKLMDPYEKMFVGTMYKTKGIKQSFPWLDRVYCFSLTENASSQASWNTYCDN